MPFNYTIALLNHHESESVLDDLFHGSLLFEIRCCLPLKIKSPSRASFHDAMIFEGRIESFLISLSTVKR